MSKVLVEGILFETEEIPPITKDNIENFPLVSQDENSDTRMITEGTRFIYNNQTNQVIVETLIDVDGEWDRVDSFVLER
jgi:hypothetical protein